jgi:hypothetical protein
MSFESPISVLYNNEGNEIAVSQSQFVNVSTQPGLVMAGSGSDGRAYFFRTSTDGSLFVTGTFAGSTPANQSVFVAGWLASVTANVTGTVALVPSASVVIGFIDPSVTASVREVGGATTTVSSANASLTNITMLAANPLRMRATFFKEGSNIAYLKFGATASATSYTVKLSNNGYYETPENYTGQIDVVFSTATAGNPLYVTSITV